MKGWLPAAKLTDLTTSQVRVSNIVTVSPSRSGVYA